MSVSVEHRDEVGLIVNLTGGHRIEGRVDGRPVSSGPRAGSVTVLPPACRCRVDIAGRCAVLMLQLRWSGVEAAAVQAGVDPRRIALRPRINDDLPELARSVFQAAAVDDAEPPDTVLAAVAGALIAETTRATRTQRSLGLTGATLRRVVARCHDQADGRPSLADLAGEAGMSVFHFARAFKVATGCTPHAFLLRHWTGIALDLLARTRLPIGDVARATGFAHAGHLARHVRRATGFAPETYRRRVLP